MADIRLQKAEHSVRLIFFGIVLTLAYIGILAPSGFLEAARLRSFDSSCRWRNQLFPKPAAVNDLLLIVIDDESRNRMTEKWPYRKTHARLIRTLSAAQPKAIHMDLVFSGAQDPASDQELAQAIREGPPILLASYLDSHGDPVLPYALFTEAGGRAGVINKPRDPDATVRRFFAAVRLPARADPLYAIEIQTASVFRGISSDRLKLERGKLHFGDARIPLEFPGTVAINFGAGPADIPTVPYWKVVQGEVPPEKIRGKIVIVGLAASAAEIHHDVYPTPLGTMPGVLISVNGILTLLTGQALHAPPFWVFFLGGLLLVLAVLFAVHGLPLAAGAGAALGLIGAGAAAGFGGLLLLHWRTESLSVIVLGSAAWLTALFYKYLLLLWDSIRLNRQVITDPLTGAFTGRYFRLRLERMLGSGRKQKSAGLLVVQIDGLSEMVQKIPLEEARERIRVLTAALQNVQKNGLLGSLGEDRFGLFLPNLRSASTPETLQRLTGSLQPFQGRLGLGLAVTNPLESVSAAALLQRAERACTRSWKKAGRTLEPYDPQQDSTSELSVQPSGGETPAEGLDYVASELEQRNKILEKTLQELRSTHKELESHFLEVTKSLVMAMDTKDAYTAGHLERVSRYATRLAEMLRLPPEETEAIREAALLHDIGKLNLPDEILHKTGPLTPEEVEVIKKHLELGAKILDPMKFFRPITSILYHHHERYDGRGYPHGLTGEFIPPGAQVITIADSFDAMTTNRGYNKPRTVQEAIEELHRGSGTQFNPGYVEAFIQVIQTEGPHLAGYTRNTP